MNPTPQIKALSNSPRSFWTLFAVLLLSLAPTSGIAVTKGFVEETQYSFDWNSGAIPYNGGQGMAGDYWSITATYSRDTPTRDNLSATIIAPGSSNRISFFLEPLVTTNGEIPLNYDQIGFDFLVATYENWVPGVEIGNVNVKGYRVPGYRVPESGPTFSLLLIGLFALKLISKPSCRVVSRSR
ncbi:MAG: hypothetical protein V4675_06935 [Verrucomicrobiota bacterium]